MMCKKFILLISFVAVLGLAGNASAGTSFWIGTVDTNWCNINNWTDLRPAQATVARLDLTIEEQGEECLHNTKYGDDTCDPDSSPGPTLTDPAGPCPYSGVGIAALYGPAYWCNAGGIGEQTLTIPSPLTLKVIGNAQIAQWGQAQSNISDSFSGHVFGPNSGGPTDNSGRIIIESGATMDVGANVTVGHYAHGIIDVNGTLKIRRDLHVPSGGPDAEAEFTGEGTVNLMKDGTISCGALNMYLYPANPGTTGLIDIETGGTSGKLIITGQVPMVSVCPGVTPPHCSARKHDPKNCRICICTCFRKEGKSKS